MYLKNKFYILNIIVFGKGILDFFYSKNFEESCCCLDNNIIWVFFLFKIKKVNNNV